ncbi:MAG TPA: FAD-binding and (Fe-S)-binding domain-containing protein [Verrucomicrobiae bacterium]|jgi:FAD/FMN-containing dehydrogenase/Fe-S oxidoreductase|nr:FAD-binding and (Fe-S)-binding domain-containing protein [Verrucomicrobiae bacterium]
MNISTLGRTHLQAEGVEDINASGLARKLKKRIEGEVRFDDGSRALYATDGSNYHQVPIGVVVPKSAEDVVETVALCREYGAPILSRGGGTSLAGQCCNVAVVMDMSKYFNRILEINEAGKFARIEPGLVLDRLREQATAQCGLTFGPDPSTHNHCTLGGMLGNNSCGVHSVMTQFYGAGSRTSDNVEEMDIVTYDGLRMRVGKTSDAELAQIISEGGRRGEIYARLKKLRDTYADLIRARYPDIPRRVSGYNLDDLLPENGFHVARCLVGSESTLVTILEAKLSLVKNPRSRSLVLLGYSDVFCAGEHVMDVLEFKPIGLEGIDHKLIEDMQQTGVHRKNIKLLPKGKGWLIVEFGGDTREESDARAHEMMAALKRTSNPPSMKLFDDKKEEEEVWKIRESGLGATAFIPGKPDAWEGWEDSAVPPEHVGEYLHDLRKLFDKFEYDSSLYGHFGQGCIHCRIPFDLVTAEGIQKYLKFTDEAANLVLRYGGSISGEHGDGQSKAELLSKMFGPELCRAFVEFKKIWDPEWKMNPGKVVKAWGRADNLRLGTDYHPWEPETHFKFPSDGNSFAHAALRCVGIGECRREEKGTMCPSYRVLHEEEHATRGRAHLLFEMLRGETIRDGWRSKEVKESLDLCLSCKGCKGDCPVKVDMATYKAEFLSHYFKHRLRPPHAFAFGLIHIWAHLASAMPRVANFFSQNPLFAAIGKFLIGVAPERRMPPFATETFKHWFFQRGEINAGKSRVLLFADTFNNYFHPDVAKAAVEVLEDAGFQVVVPKQNLCCGRPLYDYGMLDTAEKWLKQILRSLQDEIRGGTPMVVLEPSCCTVFRDELTGLFPNDQDAQRLHVQTFLLSEFLAKYAPQYPANELAGQKALVHVHCHHRAIMKLDAEEKLLTKLGLEIQIPETGCCGMAGAFGFEKGEHYDVSIKCGERHLLPAVRETNSNTLVIANGFSCHEQIVQQTEKKPLHIAEVLHRAMKQGTRRPPEPPKSKKPQPEEESVPEQHGDGEHQHEHAAGNLVASAGVVLAGLAGAYLLGRKKKQEGDE